MIKTICLFLLNTPSAPPSLTRTHKHTPPQFTACPYQSCFYAFARIWFGRCVVLTELQSSTSSTWPLLSGSGPLSSRYKSGAPSSTSLSSRHQTETGTCDFTSDGPARRRIEPSGGRRAVCAQYGLWALVMEGSSNWLQLWPEPHQSPLSSVFIKSLIYGEIQTNTDLFFTLNEVESPQS